MCATRDAKSCKWHISLARAARFAGSYQMCQARARGNFAALLGDLGPSEASSAGGILGAPPEVAPPLYRRDNEVSPCHLERHRTSC